MGFGRAQQASIHVRHVCSPLMIRDEGLMNSKTTTATILTAIISLLILEQVVYRSKKAHLPGDKWTIPVIGKFTDSLNPSLTNYKRQWYSGALSAVSVFNM
jgi:C-22 sterol desaturase